MSSVRCTQCGAENKTNLKYCMQCGYALPKPEVETAPVTSEQIKKPSKKRKWEAVGVLVGIMAFGLASWGARQIFSKPSYDKMLLQTSNEINKTCPMMVDRSTRLDNTMAMPNNAFEYNYTLIDFTKSEVNIDTLKKYIEPVIINNMKTNPQMKLFKDHKTTMIYYYKDMNGEYIGTLSVTPEMYQ